MNASLEILKRARSTLSDEARWDKNYIALDTRGGLVAENSDGAVQFCLIGALYRSMGDGFTEAQIVVAETIVKKVIAARFSSHLSSICKISAFNDAPSTRHADILEVLDAAISEVAE